MVSGRTFSFPGDNPAPVIDQETGETAVLYRTDANAGIGDYRVASLIGLATAPSWRGPYSATTAYGGSITNQDYPYDENEDPFLWKSASDARI